MASSSATSISRIGEWLWRRPALRAARAQAAQATGAAERMLNQARLLVEIARRVAEPVEALPKGSRAAALCALYRDALIFALAAEQLGASDATSGSPSASLPTLWAAASPDRLRGLAEDEVTLGAVKKALVDQPAGLALDATDDDAARARAFVERLLWDLDAPSRMIERLHVQRWTRVGLLVVLLVLLGFGARALLRGPNLVANKIFKTSSSYPECTAPNKCADIFFHTQPQDNPWIDFDLGAVKAVHRVEVTNRSDCCAERAVPLIVELSVDDKQWTQVARRDTEFSTWVADFPKRNARHVRLRVPRNTVLHFDDVAVR